MTHEDKLADAHAQARAMMNAAEKVAIAIDRNTEQLKSIKGEVDSLGCVALLIWLTIGIVGCGMAAKASPLLSDGDEIASVGTVTTITPHPSWAAPIGGSSWISIAQTGWPLATWLPNGTVVSFSEVFSLASMPSSAMVKFAADDSASLWLNGALVVPEAPTAGNGYTVCSDTAPTCSGHTSVNVLPWLVLGENVLRFDVAQRGGWSFGLNYAGVLTWLDEPPLPTPEPNYAVGLLAVALVAFALFNLGYYCGFSKSDKDSMPRHSWHWPGCPKGTEPRS